ncbi:pyridoxal phosphate-dependent aminotransferase [Pirellulales bacterium]|nr:pyridoxal phosphate-dependent aminotransferase [Pirellulales bacterium]
MNNHVSQRMLQIQAPMIPVVGEWIDQHPGTISLGQGVVRFPPPPIVAADAGAAIDGDPRINRYGLVRGMDKLLSAISEKLAAENGMHLDGGRSAIVTAGANMGFLNAILAIADVDDEIILLSPFYFNHEMAIGIAGCRAIIVPTDEQYQIDVSAIEAAISPRTRAVVTISPNNPTGAVYPRESLMAVNHLCGRRGIYHISDEAYEYFVYQGSQHFSPGSLAESSDYTISLYSLSKSYGMAGWRIGYMVIPSQLETAIKKIQDTNLICPPIVCQLAAVAALNVGSAWCRNQIAGFGEVRDLVLAELGRLGDRCQAPQPDGAFYTLVKVDTELNDMQLVKSLIRDFGVAVMPGSTFGVTSNRSIRIAYGALDRQSVADGMGRLVRGLDHLLQ